MAENRVRPASERGRNPVPLAPNVAVAYRVDAPVEHMQRPTPHPYFDRATPHTTFEELPARHHAVLSPREHREDLVDGRLRITAKSVFAVYATANAEVVFRRDGHRTTMAHRGAQVARIGARLRAMLRAPNAKEAPARRYRLWL